MVSIEQVEKLLQHADVSYEEARDALQQCDGSILDAIVLLERQGKISPRGGSRGDGPVVVLPGTEQEKKSYNAQHGESFVEAIQRGLKWTGDTFDKFCDSIKGDSAKYKDVSYRHSDEPRRDGESEKI